MAADQVVVGRPQIGNPYRVDKAAAFAEGQPQWERGVNGLRSHSRPSHADPTHSPD
ncbi:hypothetical protein SAMN04488094_103174 [Tropicimonas isoalkanivorans]|uniref:Uncharacterized protein n=1 Tax=Tropicimonas isoalkanivorans TaxID=441112 RepID=A0A1I1HIX7_9RHOB|nr:hypothetical protein SAMN04488094_103174 [Tropicimonas isoalkanivorans]